MVASINVTADPNYYLHAADEWETVGYWQGKGAERLGIEGPDLSAYKWLAKNRKPDGSKLTQRDFSNRRAVYDITFSEPKSVSIIRELSGDERIDWARAESVAEIMRDVVEPLAATRAWNGFGSRLTTTGNLAWIAFDHRLGRPVKGVPDPNGHTHVVIPNATERNGKWYALEILPIKEMAPLIQAAWHANFADKLKQLGYHVKPTRDAFEIQGVFDSTIRKFSKRSEVVEAAALRKRIKAPKARAALAALTREKKAPNLTENRLRAEWDSRLDSSERQVLQGIARLAARGPNTAKGRPPTAAVRSALDEALKRHSAASVGQVLIEALRAEAGGVQLPEARAALASLDVIRAKVGGVEFVTTREAITREKEVLRAVREKRITLARVKRGEKYESDANEIVLVNPTIEELHQVSKSTDSVTALYPYRDYRKPDRGNPNAWLEDVGGLRTEQKRPLPKLVEQAATVGKRVVEQLRRARLYAFQREARHAHAEGKTARPGREYGL